MTIVHLTPHLPPDQGANALLPFHLGEWGKARGDEILFIAHPPADHRVSSPVNVTWIPRTHRTALQRLLRTGSAAGALRIHRDARPIVSCADVVHVHSNGLLAEVGAALAKQLAKPVVLTLYGTEIWHYRRKRFGPDLFTRAYRGADAVTFYSQRLMDRAGQIGLSRPGSRVIYPAVASAFSYHDAAAQRAARQSLGITATNLLVNVKRLHPLGGQRYLIEAMNGIVAQHPETHLVICGAGALLPDLQAVARSTGVERHVTFTGPVDNAIVARYCAAADLFVLPSVLEALPTVAVEALASGTPVISADNPGGLELRGVFGDDVQIVPREDAGALAEAIGRALHNRRRTHAATAETIERRFRPDAVAREYWDVYADLVTKRS